MFLLTGRQSGLLTGSAVACVVAAKGSDLRCAAHNHRTATLPCLTLTRSRIAGGGARRRAKAAAAACCTRGAGGATPCIGGGTAPGAWRSALRCTAGPDGACCGPVVAYHAHHGPAACLQGVAGSRCTSGLHVLLPPCVRSGSVPAASTPCARPPHPHMIETTLNPPCISAAGRRCHSGRWWQRCCSRPSHWSAAHRCGSLSRRGRAFRACTACWRGSASRRRSFGQRWNCSAPLIDGCKELCRTCNAVM